jgi:hypothetical protein
MVHVGITVEKLTCMVHVPLYVQGSMLNMCVGGGFTVGSFEDTYKNM